MSVTYESVVNAAFAIVNLTDEQKKELLLKLLKNDPEPVIAALCSDNQKPIELEDKYNVMLNDEYDNTYQVYFIKQYRAFHKVSLLEAKNWWYQLNSDPYRIFASNLTLGEAQSLLCTINQTKELARIEQLIKPT